MAGIKYIHYSKVYETTRGMIKHLSMCKSKMQYTILCQIRHHANNFFIIPKVKVIIQLTRQILEQIQVIYSDKKEKSANKVGKIDTVSSGNVEKVDKVIYKSMCNITSRLKSEIQSIQNGFRLIMFNDSKRGQKEEPVEDKNAMTDVVNISGDADN